MSQVPPFVHLHVHTEFSLLDGAIRPKQMLEKAQRLGMDSVAITDHGNMFGAVQFVYQAAKAGIKPIVGSEVYVAPGARQDRTPSGDGTPNAFHLVLLVMNEKGYRNLSQLVTRGHLEGFYYHPRVDMDLLKEYNEGLIALSACIKGMVPFFLKADRTEMARKKAEELAAIFDHDRFYLEVQANNLPEQIKANRMLRELSKELSIPLVATNDCHYLNREDAEAHDVLLCIQTGKTVDDQNRLKFSTNEFYFKSREEMLQDLPEFEDALDHTARIAGRCHFEMEFGKYKYPVFQTSGNRDLNQMLSENARKGLEARLCLKEEEEGPLSEETIVEYRERLQFELDIIQKMGFSGYFLIVADFIDYARRHQIPVGPGRGSAAGSLVAYALTITNIDPLKYGLLFERFLNPQRISMPDIDIDFCINGRDEVIRYVAERYGRENVSQIITFGTMGARGVIRDVGRSLNIPLAEVDRIAKLVPEGPKVTLEKALLDVPELKRLEEDDGPAKKLLKISRALEGLARHASTHASGVVISDRPLVEYLPLFKGSRNEIMTQYTMDRIEQLGLIKFDFLGLKTLTVIKHTLELIESTSGIRIDMDKMPLDDPATYRLCSDGKSTGVFQLESDGMRELMRRLKPEVFEDMIALVALYRPGPLGSNMVDDFVNGKHGKTRIRYFLPQLEPILKETYGVILYQEQVMRIAQILADYSLSEADELRKAIGKKKPEVMAKHKERFIHGARKNGVEAQKAENLFNLIEKFGGYGFNKSHSAAYALIAYQTAYLKAHFPVEFMTALLTQDMGNQDKTIKNIAECRNMGIEILPPDMNESQADFTVIDGKIRFGLAAVKNVGLKAVEFIIQERDENGPYQNLLNFCTRLGSGKVNRRVLEGLIQCGAFDFTTIYRSRLNAGLDDVLKACGGNHDPNQLRMFGPLDFARDPAAGVLDLPDMDEWEEKERLKKEKEALGFYITGHPLAGFDREIAAAAACPIQDLSTVKDKARASIAGMVEDLKVKRTRKGDRMAVVQMEDLSGSIEVILFPDLFARCGAILKSDEPLLITGTVEKGDLTTKIIGQDLLTLNTLRQQFIKALEVSLDQTRICRELLEGMREAVFRYPGNCRLQFKVAMPSGKEFIIKADDRFSVHPCHELISEMEALTGHGVNEIGGSDSTA